MYPALGYTAPMITGGAVQPGIYELVDGGDTTPDGGEPIVKSLYRATYNLYGNGAFWHSLSQKMDTQYESGSWSVANNQLTTVGNCLELNGMSRVPARVVFDYTVRWTNCVPDLILVKGTDVQVLRRRPQRG